MPEVSERLIADDRIAAVTLTGSNRAGAAIGAAAGLAVKKAVLELGGSDAFVVLADADIERRPRTAVRARFNNAGQSCVCAKRFIVEAPVAEEFTTRFVEAVKNLGVGDPHDEKTQVGPMARDDLREHPEPGRTIGGRRRHRADRRSAAAGGGVLLRADRAGRRRTRRCRRSTRRPSGRRHSRGRGRRGRRGAPRQRHPVRPGPERLDEDPAHGAAFARRITTGAAFINAMVASDARVPFGGTKRSGYGRELSESASGSS